MYLVDTDVLSAGAPTKAVPAGALLGWMERNSGDLFVSVITIAEVDDGIARSARIGATAKAERLQTWLALVLHLYGERVLPFDLAAARLAGVLADRARALGQARVRRSGDCGHRAGAWADGADAKRAPFRSTRRPRARPVRGTSTVTGSKGLGPWIP